MHPAMSTIWKRALWQVPAILAVAAAMGIVVNVLRPDGLPLVMVPLPAVATVPGTDIPLAISLADARKLFAEKRALFIDARDPAQYQAGHIKDAVNVPFAAVDAYMGRLMDMAEPGTPLITYCEGESCALSQSLALFLNELGFVETRVLVDGWTVWRQAGLPVESD